MLFHVATQRLWVLNSSQAFIWCSLDEYTGIEQLAHKLSDTFNISLKQAESDTQLAFDSLAGNGLLEGGSLLAPSPEPAGQDLLAPLGHTVKPTLNETASSRLRLSILNTCIVIAIEDSVLLGEMLRIYAPFLDEGVVPDAPSAELSLIVRAVSPGATGLNHFDILIDHQSLGLDISRERLVPYLVTAIFQKVSRQLGGQVALHSAALTRAGTNLIFPANSGAGKTTLCAVLMAKGWGCLSDELAILNPVEALVTPLPLPMSIKSGSIDPLRRYYPELVSYPLHHRADGKQVRYLPIKALDAVNKRDSYALSAIVLPTYSPGENTKLLSVSKIIALEKITETGSSERLLTVEDIRSLISLIEKIPCYQLVYGSTEEAADVLDAFVDGTYQVS
ncbi:MAG: PqqD family peptide modification chaperone [Porticoccaceae bacterium]